MIKDSTIQDLLGLTYDDWEAERKALWEKYVPHYKQAADGVHSANIFVFEHCVLERRLCDKGMGLAELTEDQEATIADIDAHAVSILEQLYMEASVPLDARLGDVACRKCGLVRRGYKVYIGLPEVGTILHDEFCNICK